jgi:hypothetical protein
MQRGLAKENTPGLGDELRPFIIHDVLKPGMDPVNRAVSHRQLKFPHHAGEATDLLDQRLGRPRPKRHAERGHRRTQRPLEFGDVPDRLLADSF